jgi:hypothetical protein
MNLFKFIPANRLLLVLCVFHLLCITVSAQKKGASAPAATASPSAAGASASSAPVEVEWLSYSALDKIVSKITDYTCGKKDAKFSSKVAGAKVVVLDSPALQALEAYDTFYAQAEAIRTAFYDMAPKAGGGGGGFDDFADITGAVTAAAVATTSETSSSFTIQDPTAAIMLLNQLKNSNTPECQKAQYAGVYEVAEIGTVDAPSVPDELTSLASTRTDTLMGILGYRADAGNPKICAAKGSVTTTAAGASTTAAPSSTDPCVNAFNTLDSTYNAFLTALSTANSTTGQPTESAAKQGYKLRALFEGAKGTPAVPGVGGAPGTPAKPGTPVIGIYVNVAAAGGTQQVRKNLLTAIFTGDWIRYSGGVSLNVIIFEEGGGSPQIMLTTLAKFRTQLTSIKPPSEEDKKGLNQGDNLDQVFKP